MSAQPSRLTITRAEGRQLVAEGVIDSHTADELSEELRGVGTDGDVDLDLGKVEFIDSSGLRVLITAHQRLDGDGHRLVLHDISDAVARLLEITGLHEHLHIA